MGAARRLGRAEAVRHREHTEAGRNDLVAVLADVHARALPSREEVPRARVKRAPHLLHPAIRPPGAHPELNRRKLPRVEQPLEVYILPCVIRLVDFMSFGGR